MTRFTKTERIGVNEVERIFLKSGWIPRTISQTDVGIDMEVEICEDGDPTGQLIAVQIKTGESYFQEDNFGKIIYRGKNVHLKYWIKHSLPVILVLHNPKTQLTIWQRITPEEIIKTNQNWKIAIPKHQCLDENSVDELKKLNKLPIYFQRLQRLALHSKLISKINAGDFLIIEIEEWVNKLSGKARITLKEINYNDDEIILSDGYYFNFYGVESLQTLYPWAKYEIDGDYYYDDEYDEFMNNFGVWDYEEKEYAGARVDFREYRENLPKIRAISDGSGETQLYRLIINLNDLGLSFFNLNNYLDYGTQQSIDLDSI
jgi:hypothetical protein